MTEREKLRELVRKSLDAAPGRRDIKAIFDNLHATIASQRTVIDEMERELIRAEQSLCDRCKCSSTHLIDYLDITDKEASPCRKGP